jgi:hypothetical protein
MVHKVFLLLLLWPALAQAEGVRYLGSLSADLGGAFHRQDGISSVAGGAELGVVLWPGHGLEDDDSPPSIQVFLQRPSDLGVRVSGSYAWATRDATLSSPAATAEGVDATLSAGGGGWIGPVYLGASLLGERLQQTARFIDPSNVTSTHLEFYLLQPSAEVRVAVAPRYHLAATYRLRVRYAQGVPLPVNWGSIQLSLSWVPESRGSYWSVRVYNLDGAGFGGAGYVEAFLTPALGLFVGGSVEAGLVYAGSVSSSLQGTFNAGAGIWLTRVLELVPSVSVALTAQTGSSAPAVWLVSANLGLAWRFS